jgi:ATP-dependent DNA helicase RecG
MAQNFWLTPFVSKNSKKPKWISALNELGVKTPFDLLWILPNKYQPIIDEKEIFSLADLIPGQIIRVEGKLSHAYFKPLFFRKGVKILLHHAFAKLRTQKYQWNLQSFNIYPPTKEKWKSWESLEKITLIGTFSLVNGKLTLVNPKEEKLNYDEEKKEILLSYPQIKGISTLQWKKIIDSYFTKEWNNFPVTPEEFKLVESFKVIHGKNSPNENITLDEKIAIENLKTYELWCEQNLILKKKELRKLHKVSPMKTADIDDLLKLAPWPLTDEQLLVLKDVLKDLARPYPMRRLLQGEVGSGKTIIAFLSAYALATNNDVQIAIIAPTETLARQHYEKWMSFFNKANIKPVNTIAFYASLSTSEKKTLLKQIKDGESKIIIGTHALFQTDIIYLNLRYIIIDEQHRFGVEQRKALFAKGNFPHTLMMSATPIPRTLGLTHFGDLDQSIMTKSPYGSKKIKTRLVEKEHFEQFMNFIKTRLSLGEQIYVVAPVIDESEHFTYHLKYLDEYFRNSFKDYLTVQLHGKLNEVQQKENFNLFKIGKASILVATTMIEVGIDVSNASVICIFHPEQFGLSSLHQLRGRVGRGAKSGFCFLVAPYPLEVETKERLQFFEKNLDGFVLAEKDFNLRGQGNLWGIEQSGKLSSYRVAQIPQDKDLLFIAHELANKYYPMPNIILPSHLAMHFEGENNLQNWL